MITQAQNFLDENQISTIQLYCPLIALYLKLTFLLKIVFSEHGTHMGDFALSLNANLLKNNHFPSWIYGNLVI